MICGKCGVQFKDGRMGVIVKIVRALKRTRGREVVEEDLVRFRHGDEFVCPGCGAVVISSLGDAYEGETKPPDFTIKA